MRPLQISFGGAHFSYVERTETLTWDEFVAKLTTDVPQTSDKTSAGWYACCAFRDMYRDEEHMGARECLTFDFDHITPEDVGRITEVYKSFEYLIYTTHSHTKNNPRLRLLLPLSRTTSPDEFRAVSRAVADLVGIDLVAPESHKPAQIMFMPAVKKNHKFKHSRNVGAWVDVDGTLAWYADWQDRKSWPVAKNDTTYKSDELPTPAREKPGIIGAFNRVYTITEAIKAFDLPYEQVSETRWTYTKGSRPEGARTYDDDSKMHSENGTDPARGQHSAFDLVRLHRFGHKDDAVDESVTGGITDRPSFRAMVEFANSIPEVRTESAAHGFDLLPPLTDGEREAHDRRRAELAARVVREFDEIPGRDVDADRRDGQAAEGETDAERPADTGRCEDSARTEVAADPVGSAASAETVALDDRAECERIIEQPALAVSAAELRFDLARPLRSVLAAQTRPRWLLKDELERGVIALLIGKRGSYKSFKALDWACRVAQQGRAVYVVSAEGGDFDRRAKAWKMTHAPDQDLPLYVVERRLNLASDDAGDLKAIREDCKKLGIWPVLFVLDTFSKLSGGLDENDNSQVKAFIGRLDNGLKRAETGFDATVLLVAHTGHSDQGRARGASALGADTDAEYIVRRHDNGKTTVFVSRERFKASPELPPLAYEPKIVDLGYQDEEGGQVTSVVLMPTVASGGPPGNDLRAEHRDAMNFVYDLLRDGDMEYKDVIRAMAAEMPEPVSADDKPARDTRIQKAQRRFEVLEKKGYVYRKKGIGRDTVSRTAAIEVVDE